jgi:hypothetical protein
MNLYILVILFILCLILPRIFIFLEGMEYSTEILDQEPKFNISTEERGLLDSSNNKL